MKINLKSLLFHTLVPIMLSFTITMLIPSYKGYLERLNKPLEIPSIVFSIVWPILYILMGISAYIIDNQKDTPLRLMKIYYIQLFINLTYPICFFYFHNLTLGALFTLTLLFLNIILIYNFYKTNKISAYLLIPYILWLLVANYLQVGIYFLN